MFVTISILALRIFHHFSYQVISVLEIPANFDDPITGRIEQVKQFRNSEITSRRLTNISNNSLVRTSSIKIGEKNEIWHKDTLKDGEAKPMRSHAKIDVKTNSRWDFCFRSLCFLVNKKMSNGLHV